MYIFSTLHFRSTGLSNSKWKACEEEKDRNLEEIVQRAHLE